MIIVTKPDATEEQLDTLLRLTERYCVVYQTLRQPASIRVSRTRLATKGRRPL